MNRSGQQFETHNARSKTFAALLAASLGIGALAGCGSHGGSDASVQILQEIDAQQTGFTLPQKLGSVTQWDQILIVCPYGSTADLPSPFQNLPDSQLLDEGKQWLFFEVQGDNSPVKLELTREKVDFCANASNGLNPSDSDQLWNAEQQDGVWNLARAN